MENERQPDTGHETNDLTKSSKTVELQDELQQIVGAAADGSGANKDMPQVAGGLIAYDLSNLLELENAEVIMTLTQLFETTMSENLVKLKLAVEKMEWDDVVFAAHKLRSTLGVIQIHCIVEKLYVVEISAKKRQNLEEILPLVNASITDYYASLPFIKSAIAKEVSYLK
jgi:hypothetical protein